MCMSMKRIDGYIREDQFYFIASLKGTQSEHIRFALDDYIQKIKGITASASESKRKEEKNG